MAIKVNYTTNSEDIDPYIQHILKHSKNEQIRKIITIILGVVILVSYDLVYKAMRPGVYIGPLSYIFLYTFGLGFYLVGTFILIKKRNKKALLKKKDVFFGDKEVYLTGDLIHVVHKGETKEECSWNELKFFVRNDPYIYLHTNKYIHQVKSNSKIEEVQYYLKQKGIRKKM
ncbi:hypothetical protein GLW03_17565 [Halobacillus halophilus]|uniref:hypothetical protein n=1 Tax=Halobacillus halophilus TaxID=1570 RepID=UPI00136AFCFE|nr:hypothetical protein [Halobacillus halophilus]MYL31630.1 hypothetical protein [Halobacillus halophilus]